MSDGLGGARRLHWVPLPRGGAVCRRGSKELYVAIPGLGRAVCRNSCVFMSAEVSCPSEYAQVQVVSSVVGAPRGVMS